MTATESSVGSGLHLGVDACNIRQGGGITHLAQLLASAQPELSGIDRVTVWCGKALAQALPSRSWLQIQTLPWMDASLPRRILGQQWGIPRLVERECCDVVFSPGGTLPAYGSVPVVTMSQNMLPFEPKEAARFGALHPMRLKMGLLRYSQGRSFRRASGVIFLTRYAQATVDQALGGLATPSVRIPHGIEARFKQAPRAQQPCSAFTVQRPIRLLYVSILMPYKHQIEVAQAVSQLRAEGLPVEMRFVGGPWGRYGDRFQRCIDQLDPSRQYLHWSGAEPFATVAERYKSADAFVFASSCENLPNIMIEAMAAGLPIASSDRGPMPEVLGQPGCYFDPDSVPSMVDALRRLVTDHTLRQTLADAAWQKAAMYSWSRCARDTLDFIATVARRGAT